MAEQPAGDEPLAGTITAPGLHCCTGLCLSVNHYRTRFALLHQRISKREPLPQQACIGVQVMSKREPLLHQVCLAAPAHF